MASMPPSTSSEPSFRLCPGCGNLTSDENPRCAHCGLASVESVIEQRRLLSERHFLQTLFTRSSPFTMIFIGINVGVFALMCLAGGIAITAPDHAVLIGFGAKQNELISQQHQYWRLVTSIFIHVGIIHLLINNYALWIVGQEIERIYGSSRFVILYLATGVLGSLGSYAFNPQATSAGASGAIFGLFGVMATFAFRYRSEIPAAIVREIKRRVIPIIILNLIFGLSVRIVDNAAHIGGLLSGIALALVVPYQRPRERVTPTIWRALQVASLAVIIISFVGAFRSYQGPRLSFANLTSRPGPSVVTYFDQMQEAGRGLAESLQSFSVVLKGANVNTSAKEALEAVERGLRAAGSIPKIDPRADQFRDRLIELLNTQKSLIEEFGKSNGSNRSESESEETRLKGSYRKFKTEYDEWLPGFLKEHGYELHDGEN